MTGLHLTAVQLKASAKNPTMIHDHSIELTFGNWYEKTSISTFSRLFQENREDNKCIYESLYLALKTMRLSI